MAKSKAVFLDRDGVINRPIVKNGQPYPPSFSDVVEILPGVQEAIEKLRASGFLIICATNQPDVARGKQSRKAVETIHEMLLKALPLDEILVCYHDDSDKCSCRKPLPGMLIKASKEYNIDLFKSFMIGDRWRDIEAGQRAGCRTILIEYDYEKEKHKVTPAEIVSSLLEASKWILKRTKA